MGGRARRGAPPSAAPGCGASCCSACCSGSSPGLVLGTAALGERTAGAYDRLADAVGLDDVRSRCRRPARARRGRADAAAVRRAWLTDQWVVRIDGPSLRFASLGAGADQPPDLVHPVLVAGRAPAPDAADEMMISEPLAEASDLRVGTAVTLRMLTRRQIARLGSGVGDPAGPGPADVGGRGRADARRGAVRCRTCWRARRSPSRYADTAASRPAFVRLDDTPGAAVAFATGLRGRCRRGGAAVGAGPVPAATGVPPTGGRRPGRGAAERTLVVGLSIFAAVLAAGGLLVVGQGLLATTPRTVSQRWNGRWG